MNFKNTIIIYESMYHGNTKKLAEAMAKEIKCQIKTADEAMKMDLSIYQRIGLGSGIYFTSHHPKIIEIASALNPSQEVFIFSTRGRPYLGDYHQKLKNTLKMNLIQVTNEFSTKGYDHTGPFIIFGGGSIGRPNEKDQEKARKFVRLMLKDEIKPKRKLKKGVLVDVDDDCLGCAKCKNICPMHVFEMIQQKSVPVRYLDCTHCNMCTDICSQNAITIQHNPKEAIQIAIRHKDRTSL